MFPGLFLSFAAIADFYCGKMQEIIVCDLFFSLTSFSQTTAYATNQTIITNRASAYYFAILRGTGEDNFRNCIVTKR